MGVPTLMEMHTRNSLWAYLATAGGLNIPAVAYNNMLGLSYGSRKHPRTDVKWIDLNKDIKAFFDYRQKKEWTLSSWLRSYGGK